MVQANGAPITGPVTIRAELAYTNSLSSVLCTDDVAGVVLTNGVFHVKLDFDCTDSGASPGRTLTQVLSQAPAGQSVAIQITDVTHSKSYSYQALHALPFANVASQLVQMNAADGDVLMWNEATKKWKATTPAASSGGTVTNVSVGAPLTISNPTSTPSITLPQATGAQSGYLSSADWTTFNNKEGTIAGGTAAQYYRGDKSWQTLDSDAVPEGLLNLYFTNARVLGLPLTGFAPSAGAIVATDTVVQGFSKAQGQINTLSSDSTHFLKKDNTDSITGTVNVGVTGSLTITNAPALPTDAANRQYVNTYADTKLALTGGTLSGALNLDSDLKIKGGSNYVTVRGHATSAAYNFILPQTAGTSGYVLQTDGSGNLSWANPSSTAMGTGTVNSGSITDGSIVDADINASASIAQSKIANLTTDLAAKVSTTLSSGNILIGSAGNVASPVAVSGDATLSNTGVLTLANTGTAGTYSSVTVDAKGRVTGGTNPTVVTGVSVTAPITNTGTATVPLIGMPVATASANGYLSSGDFTTFNNKQDAINAASTLNIGTLFSNLQDGLVLNPHSAAAGGTGELRFKELAAGGSNYIGFKAPDAITANVIFTLPATDGTSGQVLTTNAAGVLSWSSHPTTLAPSGAAGGDLTGTYPNPTVANGLVATKISTGVVDNTEFNYLDGVTSAIQTQLSGKQANDATLTSLAAYNTNGILVQTAADTFVGRSVQGTANRVAITNGNGVSGDPTINIDTGLLPSPAGSGQWLKSTGANTSAWTTLASSDITTALGFTPVNKAGDTISTGTFNFNGSAVIRTLDPILPTDVVTKQYVDGFGQWIKNATDLYFATGSVGIGASSVNSSAIFEMTSTTKGFLPPRMTTAQRDTIASPATGLTIYNTTTGFYEYYNGSSWNLMGGGVPNGTISAFESTTCPVGWVEYTAARGQFLRGIDNGAGVDPSGTRVPGTTQTDSNKAHNHVASSAQDGAHNHTGTTATNGNHAHSIYAFYPGDTTALIVNDQSTDKLLGTDNQGGPGFFSSNQATNAGGDHNHTFTTSTSATHNHAITVNNDGGTEARPKNIAVLYCKYVGGSPSYTPPNVEGLANVNVSAPVNGQALVYDSGTSKWINQTVGSALGYTPVNKAGDTMTGTLNVPSVRFPDGTTQTTAAMSAYGMAYRTAAVSVSGSVYTTIALNGGNTSLNNVSHSTGTNPSRVTMTLAGTYRITYNGYVLNQAGAAATMCGRFLKNGATVIIGSTQCASLNSGWGTVLDRQIITTFAANDYIEFQAWANMNLSFDVTTTSTNETPILVMVERIGP